VIFQPPAKPSFIYSEIIPELDAKAIFSSRDIKPITSSSICGEGTIQSGAVAFKLNLVKEDEHWMIRNIQIDPTFTSQKLNAA
jgi:hypothetical protein